MRIDALVNERLSGSSRVVDIYAFCGTGMINEAMLNGDMYQRAAPYGHYGRAITKKEKKEGGLVVSNNFTGIEKLRFSLEMAEAVAVLHSFKDGVIVHDDIKPAQFLWTDDNRIKLNDFNRAVVLQWDDANNEYCPFYSGAPQGVVSLLSCFPYLLHLKQASRDY